MDTGYEIARREMLSKSMVGFRKDLTINSIIP